MKNLLIYFEDGTIINKDTMIAEHYKYDYAAAFLNTIFATQTGTVGLKPTMNEY